MASHPYPAQNASTTSTDNSRGDSRPYADRLILPPIAYQSGERPSNLSSYFANGPSVTLPAIQTGQQYHPYHYPSERPMYQAHGQSQASKYSSLPASPYEFMAGKTTGHESRQIRKIAQRRDVTDELHRIDRKSDPMASRSYVQSKPMIRPSSPIHTFHSSKSTAPDAYRASENRNQEADTVPRELKKRSSSGGLPKSKEQKTREKHSLLPISDLISADSRWVFHSAMLIILY